MNELTKRIFTELNAQMMPTQAQIPPPFMKGLEMTYLAYEPKKSVTVSFPIKAAYNNPFGITFGGYFAIFFDAAFGPFSGLTAGAPTTSLDLNVTFIKSLSPKDKEVIVEVEIVNHTKSYLILNAKAYKGDRVLVATATSRMLILKVKS